MKLVLLVHVLIGATRGSICPDGHTSRDPPEAGETDRSTMFLFETTSCGTTKDKIGHVGTSAMSFSEWSAAMGHSCTPPHGECFTFTAACEAKLAAICKRKPGAWKMGRDKFNLVVPKGMKIWYADQGGMPADINMAAIVAGSMSGVALFLILWLANCFAKPGPGPLPACPSPLFKAKPKSAPAMSNV